MSAAKSENKQLYMRVHTGLEPAIEAFCRQTGMKPATAVAWILNRYMTHMTQTHPDLDGITRAELGFVPQAEAYYAPIGRSDTGRVLGRRRMITVSRALDRGLVYLAEECGLRPTQFRTAVLATYFSEMGLL